MLSRPRGAGGPAWFRLLASVALTLIALALLDRAIGGVEGGGPYRKEIWRPIAEVRRAAKARHVVLGCSTSNWFPEAITQAFGVARSAVVDAHMSDCLPACTMAEARRIASLGRRFETATFGVNIFEYCEDYRERRSMQEVELLPLGDSFELARLYAHSEDPLQHAGGWLMNHVSDVYGNTMWLQRHFRKRWFGKEALSPEWYRRQQGVRRPGKAFRCDYLAADRDFGFAATAGALRALEAIAERVHLVLLPDRAYAERTEPARATRELFRSEHHELVQAFDRVAVVDLLDESLTHDGHFRDGAHLNGKGVKLARKLLRRRLPKPEASAVGEKLKEASRP